ncbi:MAG: hypothetical protein NVS3B18_10410 [Candidatus Dormibacteria bacterium]
MCIVWPCALSVEAYAQAGREVEVPRLHCPSCGRTLASSSGHWRFVRVIARPHLVWLSHGRCRRCASSHTLLPSFLLARRVDPVAVIGGALERVVGTGEAMQRVAQDIGVPHSTVRDWCRRFRCQAAVLAAGLAALVVECGGDAPPWQPTTTAPAAALNAVAMLRDELTTPVVSGGDAVGWELAGLVCGGELLCVATSPRWATAAGRSFMPPHPSTLTEELPHAP